MELNEVLSNLCDNDLRNPDSTLHLEYDSKEEAIADGYGDFSRPSKGIRGSGDGCYCDNCFYGRTKLAEYILKILNHEPTQPN